MKTTRAKKLSRARNAIIDKKVYGDEPKITSESSISSIADAYNWYNYFHDSDDAKGFIIAYLRSIKYDKNYIKQVYKVKSADVRSVGWNFRILQNGGSLPEEMLKKSWEKLELAISKIDESVVTQTEDAAPVVSIKERVENKVSFLVSEIEEQIDVFYKKQKNDLDFSQWFREKDIKPAIAAKIAEYYEPLYEEVSTAVLGKDDDIKYAYRKWKKPALKKFQEFLKNILAACEVSKIEVKKTRKPRAKKVKSSTEQVKGLKYKEKDEALGIDSVKPSDIIGSAQLWTFNTKTRVLSVYNSIGPAGLQVKGTSVTGFDKTTSVCKTIRKPTETIPMVKNSAKNPLKKVMAGISTKEKPCSGRINTDTILLRTIK